MNALLVAAPQSGAGKTLVSLALMAYLKEQGRTVQAYKVGPDFIDPGHHCLVTGRLSQNLDGWMLKKEVNEEIFFSAGQGADWLVVEGVMGLFDGYSPVHEAGSTAQIAKWLDLPLCLVVDAKAMARSIAALLKGFLEFDPELRIAGVLFNRVGSAGHARILQKAVEHYLDVPCLGFLPPAPHLEIPSRHLGLVTAEDACLGDDWQVKLAEWIGPAIDWPVLEQRSGYQFAESAQKTRIDRAAHPGRRTRVRIAVAKDAAFCFYYAENLRLLEDAGGELCFFSPLADQELPAEVHGLYLGGGYPELFAAQLACNRGLKEQIKLLASKGMPIYAECGGFMCLLESLEDQAGNIFSMLGIFPFKARMGNGLQALGYREVETAASSLLGPAGTLVRGHEFHYSFLVDSLDNTCGCRDIYRTRDRRDRKQRCSGWLQGNVLGSYVHLHFGSNKDCARHFVEYCQQWTII